MQQIEQIAGLLVGGDSDPYEFAHKTFQEYLVAAEIMDQDSTLPLIERLRQPDWQPIEDWKEIFSFYAALTRADFLVDEIEKMSEGEKRRNTTVLLNQIVSTEKSKITPEHRQQLEAWVDSLVLTDLNTEQVAMITLEQRFQKMIDLDEGVSITSAPITWNEYQQFLEAQANGQFHSTAETQEIAPNQQLRSVEGISDTDRNWFCAWLATQTSLQSETQLYDYRVPTPEQYQQAGIENTMLFRVARVPLESKYQKLVNLLANRAWIEADRETELLMLKICREDSSNYLLPKDLTTFPCADLWHIDQLWLKNSGGHFGFSLQKKIFEECGSPKDYNETWKKGGSPRVYNKSLTKFCDRVGWRTKGEWLSDKSVPSLLSSPQGNLPLRLIVAVGEEGENFKYQLRKRAALFSRAQTCGL